MLDARARLITFRLSTEQYEFLLNACRNSGARSVSDFARTAVLAKAAVEKTSGGMLLHDLSTLTRMLHSLDEDLTQIRSSIHRVLGMDKAPEELAAEKTSGS